MPSITRFIPGHRVEATNHRFYHVTEQDLFEGVHLLMVDQSELMRGIDPSVNPCLFGTVIELDEIKDGLVHYHSVRDHYPCFVPFHDFTATKGEAQYWIPLDTHDLHIPRHLAA